MAATVVRLPTAASRKPNNLRYAAQRQAARAARKAEPWPGEHKWPGEREADALAADLTAIEQTAALVVASAILRCLDDATYAKVLAQLAPAINSERPSHRQALATARASRMTIGDSAMLGAALDRLNAGGRA